MITIRVILSNLRKKPPPRKSKLDITRLWVTCEMDTRCPPKFELPSSAPSKLGSPLLIPRLMRAESFHLAFEELKPHRTNCSRIRSRRFCCDIQDEGDGPPFLSLYVQCRCIWEQGNRRVKEGRKGDAGAMENEAIPKMLLPAA